MKKDEFCKLLQDFYHIPYNREILAMRKRRKNLMFRKIMNMFCNGWENIPKPMKPFTSKSQDSAKEG